MIYDPRSYNNTRYRAQHPLPHEHVEEEITMSAKDGWNKRDVPPISQVWGREYFACSTEAEGSASMQHSGSDKFETRRLKKGSEGFPAAGGKRDDTRQEILLCWQLRSMKIFIF